MDEVLVLKDIREKYESSIVKQRNAFEEQSNGGDRVKLANIAAEATRELNHNRRQYENAVWEFYKRK